MIEYVFPVDMLSLVRRELLDSSPNEAAAVLLAQSCFTQARLRFLVRESISIPREHYTVQTPVALCVSPLFLAPIIKRARTEGLSLVLAHSHPFSQGHVRFSTVDDEGENKLMPSIFARTAEQPHGALVLGIKGFDARTWTGRDGSVSPVHRLVEVGRHFTIHERDASFDREAVPPFFDRSVRAFGEAGQRTLAALHVAIVGVGGTGSIVAEQLAHLGTGHIHLLDYDRLEETNLNRVVGSFSSQVGIPKVEVALKHIRRIREDILVSSVQGDVLSARDARGLLDSDIIFCCTDSHGSRFVLNQIAYQFMIPVIDMGVRIQVVDGQVEGMSGRIQMLAPGLACLVCQEFLDPAAVRRDLLTQTERAADPYIVGAAVAQPAVISLNGTVASLAVTMMLSAVTGFPSDARHQVYVGTRGVVRTAESLPQKDCVVCSGRGALGRGDSWSMPGRPD